MRGFARAGHPLRPCSCPAGCRLARRTLAGFGRGSQPSSRLDVARRSAEGRCWGIRSTEGSRQAGRSADGRPWVSRRVHAAGREVDGSSQFSWHGSHRRRTAWLAQLGRRAPGCDQPRKAAGSSSSSSYQGSGRSATVVHAVRQSCGPRAGLTCRTCTGCGSRAAGSRRSAVTHQCDRASGAEQRRGAQQVSHWGSS